MGDKKFAFYDGCFLHEEPIKSPEAVIQEFYTQFDFEYVKITIWRLFKGAMSEENAEFINPKEIGEMIFFIETFLMLNMAVYELNLRLGKKDGL